jgi:hypothetical protein
MSEPGRAAMSIRLIKIHRRGLALVNSTQPRPRPMLAVPRLSAAAARRSGRALGGDV